MEKGVLRHAVKDLLPYEILMRKKSPYPKTYDPQYTDIIVDMFRDDVLNNNSPLLQLFDADNLNTLCNEAKPRMPWFGQLMSTPQLRAYLWQIDRWLNAYNISINI